jgi:protein involved in polysaccharide export with SLBB domain/capsular polysaccharide biosynthesis protein
MNDPGEFSLSEINRKREQHPTPQPATPAASPTQRPGAPSGNGPDAIAPATPPAGGFTLPFDPLRLLVAAVRSWPWATAAGIGAGVLAAFLGLWRFDTHHTASIQLIRRELPNSFRATEQGDAFRPRQFSVATITALMRSPGFLKQVAARATPRLTGRALAGALTITPERNTDLISVAVQGLASAEATATLANQYAEEVVELTKTLQSQEAAELNRFLRERMAKTEADLAAATQELLKFSTNAGVYSIQSEIDAYLRDLSNAEMAVQTAQLDADALEFRIAAAEKELGRLSPAKLKLATEREKLQGLLTRFTEEDPQVIEQIAQVEALEQKAESSTNTTNEFQAGGSLVANSLYLDLVGFRAQRDSFTGKLQQLETSRERIRAKLQGMPEKGLLLASIKARQTSLEVTRDLLSGRQREAELFTENSPGYYRLFAPTTAEQTVTSSRNRKVLIVAAAGSIFGASLAVLLACFLELLNDRIVTSNDVRRIAKVPVLGHLEDLRTNPEAASEAWRFRIWSLLLRALNVRPGHGLTAAFLSAREGEGCSTWIHLLGQATCERGSRALCLVNRAPDGSSPPPVALEDALQDPALIVAKLPGSGQVLVLIPPGWVWDLHQRQCMQGALKVWGNIPALAILVELPPASRLDAILMAESFPNVLWLSSSGMARQREAAPPLADMRLAGVPLKGAFLNRLPTLFAKLSQLTRIGLILAGTASWLGSSSVFAQIPPPAAAETNTLLSATAAGPKLAPWQQHLTLGPGDLVNISIYGQRDSVRSAIPIGPDGRISYLQIQDVMASGLTIDELRETLTAEIARFERHSRVIVTPNEYRSKKFYLMGTIMDKGAYTLDRPMTILEAIAQARGIATGLLDQTTVEIADLSRAFLVRNGKRLPIDFEKLFEQGDLTQNILLEPGDYLYFPSDNANSVYVLGAVLRPGPLGAGSQKTLLGAITARGGFVPGSFRQRVLIVRGSLNQPKTIVVNVAAILSAREPDVPIEAGDIIYVNQRPWLLAEELLETAIKSFVQSAAANWAAQNIGPFITEPFIPSTR